MIGFFRVLGRVLWWLLRTRALRPVFGLAIFLWILDGTITSATDAAWFSSVGQGELWREQCLWTIGVATTFVVLALLASIPLMRAVAHPVAKSGIEEPALPRALARWQPLRAKVIRLAWVCISVIAILLGRGLSGAWSDFALASSPPALSGSDFSDFWMLRASALQSALAGAWAFCLGLGLVAVGAGVLRALPFLAARPSIPPVRWLRALWGLGATLCVLRALGYVFEAMRHAQIANDSNAARVGFVALNTLGALGCVALIVLLRRPRSLVAAVVLAVLVLPGFGGDLLAPFVGHSSGQPPTPTTSEIPVGTPKDWPQWDEVTLLRAARIHLPRDSSPQRHLIDWQRAGIALQGSRAEIVGSPVQTDEWAGHGMTDREGEIAWWSVELPQQSRAPVAHPAGRLFYGLDARPLLSDETGEVGVPFQGWLWKWAWAWRLRDPLLLVEGTRSKRLLVMRGTREIGQKLAPFWTWDDVVPRRNLQTGDAYFECVAYSSSARAPRSAPFESGIFAGQNQVSPVAVLRLDARSGTVRLFPFASSPSPSVKVWQKVVPPLFGSNAPQYAPTPSLEVALAGGTSLVWVRTPRGWQKKAVPVELRDSLSKKLDEFRDTARVNFANRLESATPVLWAENGALFLAQAFFDFEVADKTRESGEAETLPSVTGVAAGPLKEHGARWSATFAGALAALNTPNVSPSSVSTPGSSATPATRPLRDLAQEALLAQSTAKEALKSGRYVEAQKQNERVQVLLEELARRAP